jgi:hypothetical protein
LDAYSEFKEIEGTIRALTDQLADEKTRYNSTSKDLMFKQTESDRLQRELDGLSGKYDALQVDIKEKEKLVSKHRATEEEKQKRLEESSKKLEQSEYELKQLRSIKAEHEKTITEYELVKDERQKEYEKNVAQLNQLKQQLEDDRVKVKQDREAEIRTEFEQKKRTWAIHERIVESKLKEICRKHGVDYLNKEQIPFKGKPDNTVKICGEFVIFDAKSPQNEDLSNFPSYVKQSAESAKKYVKEENVKKDVFLVIPSNTVSEIEQSFYNMADYNVYVITP